MTHIKLRQACHTKVFDCECGQVSLQLVRGENDNLVCVIQLWFPEADEQVRACVNFDFDGDAETFFAGITESDQAYRAVAETGLLQLMEEMRNG